MRTREELTAHGEQRWGSDGRDVPLDHRSEWRTLPTQAHRLEAILEVLLDVRDLLDDVRSTLDDVRAHGIHQGGRPALAPDHPPERAHDERHEDGDLQDRH